MNNGTVERRNRPFYEDGLITALSIGGFFIILGVVFGLTPGVWNATNAFFQDLKLVHLPITGSLADINLLGPANPSAHANFYSAVFNFCIGIGVLSAVVLALRLILRSPLRRISQSVGDLVFWFGAAAAVNAFLLIGTLTGWFQFWAAIIIILGLSLIIRGIVHLVTWRILKR